MFEVFRHLSPYLQYLAPPLVGAFIGYLTNKIAIRMLFRPLSPWHIFGLRVPMTPGVIPAKRHQLAVNIGEMVGGHLLTSKEIGAALARRKFQDHLAGLIKNRVGTILEKDLSPLPDLIPKRFLSYFDIGKKIVSYQIKQQINQYIETQDFEKVIAAAIDNGMDDFLDQEIDVVFDQEKREMFYAKVEHVIGKMLTSRNMEQWIEDFLFAQMNKILRQEKSINQVLPDSLTKLIVATIESKVPDILEKIGAIIQDNDIQNKIVEGIKKGVDSFSESLGPMGAMVQNFLSVETIEKAVKEYLTNNEDDISRMLRDKNIQKKVTSLLLERTHHYLNTPLVSFLSRKSKVNRRKICKNISEQISILLREKGIAKTISSMLKENAEIYIQGGGSELNTILIDSVGENGVKRCKKKLAEEALLLLRSQTARDLIERGVDKMINSLLKRPVGKLSNFLPTDVREGMYDSIQKISSEMLEIEVPGLVASLNIQQIVAEKVDSLDLLRLEALLLSIMEEQFKYINLFGALLGLLIGSLNVLLIYFF